MSIYLEFVQRWCQTHDHELSKSYKCSSFNKMVKDIEKFEKGLKPKIVVKKSIKQKVEKSSSDDDFIIQTAQTIKAKKVPKPRAVKNVKVEHKEDTADESDNESLPLPITETKKKRTPKQ